MFDGIAHRYDLLNRVLSFGQDVSWRRRAIRLASAGDVRAALDVGAGTGDLALALAGGGVPEVVAVDLAAAMLARARNREREKMTRRPSLVPATCWGRTTSRSPGRSYI